jgi:hypothetical protein
MTDARQWRFCAVIAGPILVAACSGKATTKADAAISNAAVPATPAAAPATPAAAPATGALTAEFMAGKWSAMNGDCAATLDFMKDGTVTTPIGKAKWTAKGNTLTFDYGDGSKPTVSTVKPVGADKIEFTHDSGAKEIEKRCS